MLLLKLSFQFFPNENILYYLRKKDEDTNILYLKN